jgi:DHA1 family bicyclomycin/chloramphenicol resistance-like MFS transporter
MAETKKVGTGLITVILGLCTALTLFSTDLYAPALPDLPKYLGGTLADANNTISLALIGTATGLIVFGACADVIGRKKTLQIGIAFFILANIGCILAPTMPIFLVCRIFSGFGVSAAQVAAASVPFDMFSGEEASKMVSKVVMVVGVSPIVAPIVGQLIYSALGSNNLAFRATLVLLVAMAVAAIAMVTFLLPESLPVEKRQKLNIGALATTYFKILTDFKSLMLLIVGGLSYAIMFCLMTNWPVVTKEIWKIGDVGYLVTYAFVAIGTIVGGMLNIGFVSKYGRKGMLYKSMFAMLIMGVVAAGATFVTKGAMIPQMLVFVAAGFLFLALCQVVNPNITGLIVDRHLHAIGASNAMVSAMQNVGASLVTPGAILFFQAQGSHTEMGATWGLPFLAIAWCAIIALGIVFFSFVGAKNIKA